MKRALLLGTFSLLAACGESPTTPTSLGVPEPMLALDISGLTAKACLKNGWKELVTSTGSPFASQAACVTYAARGGKLYARQKITFNSLPGKAFGDADFNVSATATSGLTVTFTASGACTVSGKSVHLTSAGSCTITAHQPGNANVYAAPDVARSFAIAMTNQTITFAALAAKTYGDADFNVGATASSGLPVSFTASGNCTIGGITVHLTGGGSCTITAQQPGDASWNAAADVPQSFAIAGANQTITFAPLVDKTFGDGDFAVSATASSGLSVTFAAADNCTIAANSVHITGAGVCTITASQAGDANWNAATDVPQAFTTAQGSQTVSFTSTNPGSAVLGGPTYTPTATATSGLPVAITLDGASSGCSLASGVVSFTGPGVCVVDANQAGNGNWNPAAQQQQSITVSGCIGNEAALRYAAAAGGSYDFCAAGTTIVLTGGEVPVGTTLSLTGVSGGNAVINANSASRVFSVSSSGNLTLRDVTVTGGVDTQGAGIAITGGVVTLNGNSSVTGNVGCVGVGVIVALSFQGGQLIMNDAATVSNNRARRANSCGTGGGGVYVNQTGSLTMNATSAISSNVVDDIGSGGGGVLINAGTVQMNGSAAITGNSVTGTMLGGGIYFVNGGSLTLTGSARISGNSASDGGGILRWDNNAGSITGVTASNVTGNTPNNCASRGLSGPVPGCVP